MADLTRMRRVYGKFDPHHLPSDSEYVDFDSVRTESVLEPLFNSLLLADPSQSVARLFGGGRGAGKTTELRRFERKLRSQNFIALYIDVEETLDVNNCDFADFLVAIAYGLQKGLEASNIIGYDKISQYVRSKVEEVLGFFSQRVRIPGGDVGAEAGGTKAKVELKFERPQSRQRIVSEEFEALASDAVIAVSELIRRLHSDFIERGYAGLVLLVDGGDKIVPFRAGSDDVSQHTRIFAQRATQLCSLACHVVYSVPLSFCYSADAQHFNATSGAPPIVLPMTSLRGKNKSSAAPGTDGYNLFLEVVQRRLLAIGETIEAMFEEDALKKIILMSGGNPTALMTIVQESIIRNKGILPVGRRAVDQAVQSMANALNRLIDTTYWPVLKRLVDPVKDIDKSEVFMSSLYYQFIYEYMNGGSWFEVNPVLKTLDQLSS